MILEIIRKNTGIFIFALNYFVVLYIPYLMFPMTTLPFSNMVISCTKLLGEIVKISMFSFCSFVA